jgi:hypothetical protein
VRNTFAAPFLATSVGCLGLWPVAHFIPCALDLAEPVVIASTNAFFATRHPLVAGRQPLTGVLFPDVEGLLFLFGRKAVVFDQIIGSFIVGLRMFNFVDLRFRSMGRFVRVPSPRDRPVEADNTTAAV